VSVAIVDITALNLTLLQSPHLPCFQSTTKGKTRRLFVWKSKLKQQMETEWGICKVNIQHNFTCQQGPRLGFFRTSFEQNAPQATVLSTTFKQ